MSSTKGLTASEICSIIVECGKSGVSEFTFGGLKINFNYKPSIEGGPLPLIHPPTEESTKLEVRARSKKEEFINTLEEARLADPVLYEELIALDEDNDGIKED